MPDNLGLLRHHGAACGAGGLHTISGPMSQPMPTAMHTLLQQGYIAARQHAGAQAAIAVLHLGSTLSGVALGEGAQPSQLLVLALGLQSLARTHFRTLPPTPQALEHAIAEVEDRVMPLHASLSGSAHLYSGDGALREVVQVAHAAAQGSAAHATLPDVEHTFNRLCDGALGRPMSLDGLPQSTEFAAALLVLREFMHHLGLQHITVLPA